MPDTSGHAAFFVWAADPEKAGPVLQSLATGYDVTLLDSLPDNPDTPPGAMLLLHLAPAVSVCRAIFAGLTPDQALEEWQTDIRAILTLNRRNRRTVQLIDIAMARAWPQAFREWFGLPAAEEAMPALPNDREDPLLLALAEHLLRRSPDGQRLMSELDAVSINLSDNPEGSTIDIEAAFARYQQTNATARELEAARSESQRLQRDLVLLEGQAVTSSQTEKDLQFALEQAFQETDQLVAQNRDLQDALTGLQQDLADRDSAAQSRIEALETLLEERRRETELLQAQGLDLQQELEKQAQRNTVLDAAVQEASRQRQALETALAETRVTVEDLQAAYAALQDKNKALDDARDALEQHAAALETSVYQAGERESALGESLDEALQAAALLSSREHELQQELIKVDRHRAELAATSARLPGLERDLDMSRVRLRALIAEKERQAQATQALIRKLQAGEAEAQDTLRAALARRGEELARLQQELDHVRAERDRLYGSRSYRLAAPLRRIRAALVRA